MRVYVYLEDCGLRNVCVAWNCVPCWLHVCACACARVSLSVCIRMHMCVCVRVCIRVHVCALCVRVYEIVFRAG